MSVTWKRASVTGRPISPSNLMALREAGLLSTRRDGKYIYYRLEKPEIMEMVELAARLAGLDVSDIAAKVNLCTKSTVIAPSVPTQKEDHVSQITNTG